MIRFLLSIALCSLMFGCSSAPVRWPSGTSNSPPDTTVLRIEVIENEWTGLYPPSDCPAGHQCIEMYGWSKYRARVKEVLVGDWDQNKVTFARLEHASFIEEATRDCYVIMHAASSNIQTNIGVPFVADKLLCSFIESHRAEIKKLRGGR